MVVLSTFGHRLLNVCRSIWHHFRSKLLFADMLDLQISDPHGFVIGVYSCNIEPDNVSIMMVILEIPKAEFCHKKRSRAGKSVPQTHLVPDSHGLETGNLLKGLFFAPCFSRRPSRTLPLP